MKVLSITDTQFDEYFGFTGAEGRSNEESGLGYSDILIEVPESSTGVVIELKYAESGTQMEQACNAALQQIEERHYDEVLLDDGMTNIVKYGIACYKKQCRVEMG